MQLRNKNNISQNLIVYFYFHSFLFFIRDFFFFFLRIIFSLVGILLKILSLHKLSELEVFLDSAFLRFIFYLFFISLEMLTQERTE